MRCRETTQLGGHREPAQLNPVVVILGIEKGSIRQSLVSKVPGVRVLLVEIADPGEKAAGAQRKFRQAGWWSA
jgi:hypothetical protein